MATLKGRGISGRLHHVADFVAKEAKACLLQMTTRKLCSVYASPSSETKHDLLSTLGSATAFSLVLYCHEIYSVVGGWKSFTYIREEQKSA